MALHIYYRHAPARVLGFKSRPDWFGYGRCFANLVQSVLPQLANGHVTLCVVFDGAKAEFEADEVSAMLRRYFGHESRWPSAIRLRFISGGDQRRAWRAAVATVLDDVRSESIKPEDFVYFLENDYVHVHNWYAKFEELVSSQIRWDYITFYDHLDKYPDLAATRDSHRYVGLRSQIFCTGSHHWRTTPSTCATYLLPVNVLLRDRAVLATGIYDYRLFRILTAVRRRRLLSPIPSLSTHCMSEFLAPVIHWEGQLN